MTKGFHGVNEETFEELSYANQASSLNAQILIIEKAINAHVRKAISESRDFNDVKDRYILQLERLIKGLKS